MTERMCSMLLLYWYNIHRSMGGQIDEGERARDAKVIYGQHMHVLWWMKVLYSTSALGGVQAVLTPRRWMVMRCTYVRKCECKWSILVLVLSSDCTNVAPCGLDWQRRKRGGRQRAGG